MRRLSDPRAHRDRKTIELGGKASASAQGSCRTQRKTQLCPRARVAPVDRAVVPEFPHQSGPLLEEANAGKSSTSPQLAAGWLAIGYWLLTPLELNRVALFPFEAGTRNRLWPKGGSRILGLQVP